MEEEREYYDPPSRVLQFLRWFCADSFLDEIEGDLFELYQEDAEEYGLKKAKRRYVLNTFRYFRPFFWKRQILSNSPIPNYTMFKHNFIIASRHLLRHKFYSLIKITGFALGISAFLLIGLFIRNELSYDRHHPHYERLYRVVHSLSIGDYEANLAWTATPLAQKIREEFPEVENAARLRAINRRLIKTPDQASSNFEDGFAFAEHHALEIFNFPLLYGDSATALTAPFDMIISSRMADKYFPGENPVGQQMILDNNEEQPYQIAGVLAKTPHNTFFDFDFLISMEGDEPGKSTSWMGANYPTYLLLSEGVDPGEVERKLENSIVKEHIIPAYKQVQSLGYDENNGNYVRLQLQPVKDIHLHSVNYIEFNTAKGDIRYIWIFGTIAIFILIIASINLMNLSTAQSVGRAKEVGVRKVLGVIRIQLIYQFLTESMAVILIAFVLGVFLTELSLSYFNQIIGIELSIPWGKIWFLPALLGIALVIGILSGLYPSFYLSSFLPVKVLKGNLASGQKTANLRSALVVFQFAISVILIIGTLTVIRQMRFMQNKKLGFDEEQVLMVQNTYTLGEKPFIFKEQISSLPQVTNISMTEFIPIPGQSRSGTNFWAGTKRVMNQELEMQKWTIDENYIPTLGMEVIAGRNFSGENSADTKATIINEKAAKRLGFENPVGEYLTTITGYDNETNEFVTSSFRIIGVVKDFHYESIRTEIGGVCLFLGNNPGAAIIRVKTDDMAGFIAQIEDSWMEFSPPQAFQYAFLDESLDSIYQSERLTARLFTAFSILAIVIACLGLFALAAFTVEQRTREIGIRKVLGASAGNIYQLLVRHFILLLVISLALAIPAGWILMQKWLQDFAYRIDLSWDIFLISGGIAFLIALITISYQATTASAANPVDTLRQE